MKQSTKKSKTIQVRVDKNLSRKAEEVFEELGITPSMAIKMFYAQVASDKGINFNLKINKKAKNEFYDKWKELKPLSEEVSQVEIDEAIKEIRKNKK